VLSPNVKPRALDVGQLTPGERRTLERLKACRDAMRAAGLWRGHGYVPPAEGDPRVVWRAAGWVPSRWCWDHAERGYRPFRGPEDKGLSLPSPMPLEPVPLIDHVRNGRRVERREG
jgi:hypothetical protein